MIGQAISHYRILEKLGGGGMGVIYKAEDTRLKRTVALKFLPPDLTRDEDAKTRFIHEAQAASALQHPNICTIHDVEQTDDHRLFIVMDCYEGESLRQMIERGPLPIETAVDIATQVAQGLAKAHEAGIVHRDIKPANIMIGKDGIVRIVDFGLAKLSGQTMLTKSGSIVGTAAYMSPEQTRGEKVDHRTDIWSLGVVLYEMLTGRKPFESEYEQALMYSILSGEPKPIEEIRRGVPPEIIGIVQRATEKESERRFQTAAEMAVSLRGEGKPQKKKMSRKKKRVLWYAVATFVLLGAAVGSYLTMVQAETIDSIAVLPPRSLSTLPEDSVLSEGILDGLIDELARIRELTTKGRRSVLKFAKTDKNYAEIAKELGGVEAFVELSYHKTGNAIRLNTKVIKCSDESVIWSGSFERRESEVMMLYGEIAQAIVRNARIDISPEEQEKLKRARPVNPEAYAALIKGRYFRHKIFDEAVKKSEIHLKQAIALDTNYAAAYAELALTYAGFLQRGFIDLDSAAFLIKTNALKALAIDAQTADAYTMLAYLGMVLGLENAGDKYRKALDINPGSAEAHGYYGAYLIGEGQLTQALTEARHAIRLEPLDLQYRLCEAWPLHWMGRHEDEVRAAKAAIELDSTYAPAYWFLTRANTYLSRYEEARQASLKYESLVTGDIFIKALVAILEARMGRVQQAHTLIREIREQASRGGSGRLLLCNYWFGQVYALLGEKDSAFACLNRAIEVDLKTALMHNEPSFENLRDDPRYAQLRKKVGLDK